MAAAVSLVLMAACSSAREEELALAEARAAADAATGAAKAAAREAGAAAKAVEDQRAAEIAREEGKRAMEEAMRASDEGVVRAKASMARAESRGQDRVLPGETHLSNVRQMTFGGQNAEAYWSWDSRSLTLQITGADGGCDQIYVMDAESGELTQLTSRGRTTCAYFLPGDERVVYASTHETSEDCPPEPDRSQGYVWPLFEYEIYSAKRDGSDVRNITNLPGYDAEATVAADGRIVFTSTRSGDLELWTMNSDGGELRQLTHEPGYDGGAFFSPDGTKLVWRASRPQTKEEKDEYFGLLGRGLVRPSRMELFVADADGSNAVQITNNGKANFAPYFTPDGGSILFASNMGDPQGRTFEIWKIDVDGGNLERVTHDPSGFNGFPMFSRDGRRIAFSSNRFGSVPRETNVFIADWTP
jgi:Tol biopolymer transport system component